MSHPRRAVPVKPLVSIMFAQKELAPGILGNLMNYLGPADLISEWLPFHQTEYYAPEMGPNLGRRLVSFLHLADPGALPAWKVHTNSLESRYALGPRRLVNIDPGYLARERLVLATGKNFSHRCYLNNGIYGDLTLIYEHRQFKTLPWTYPDYASPPFLELLTQMRKKYLWQLREVGSGK
jgi:hypothetical protein